MKFKIFRTSDWHDEHEIKDFNSIPEALEYCWSIAKRKDFEEIIIKKPRKYNYDKRCDEFLIDRDYDLEIYDDYRE